jgi:hypothetical protein
MSDADRRRGRGDLLRQHYFWDCPVAGAVRGQLAAALPGGLERAHLWLARPPARAVHQGVWQVVCLSALGAMEHGRRLLWRLWMEPREAGRAPPGAAQVLQQAGRAAVAWFWVELEDFCTTPGARSEDIPAWGPVPAGHPFLAPGLGAPGLVARVPDGL